jgi:hypothetical protein
METNKFGNSYSVIQFDTLVSRTHLISSRAVIVTSAALATVLSVVSRCRVALAALIAGDRRGVPGVLRESSRCDTGMTEG